MAKQPLKVAGRPRDAGQHNSASCTLPGWRQEYEDRPSQRVWLELRTSENRKSTLEVRVYDQETSLMVLFMRLEATDLLAAAKACVVGVGLDAGN